MNKKNVLIAITIIVSLCLLYWGIEFLKGINMFTPANFYYAKFDKVDGLVEAAPISVNGFPVGQVREISYDYATNEIRVMMAMNRDLRIPQGSTATVETSLTGTATLVLELAQADTYYNVGDEIRGVSPAGLMDKVTDNVMPQVEALLPTVDSIATGLNALVGDPALRLAVARLNEITHQLAMSTRQLNTLMTSLNSSVPAVMGNVDGITTRLSTASTNVADFTADLKQLPLDTTMARLNAAVANVQALSEQLNNPESTLGLLMNDRTLYDNATRTVADLDSLMVDIKKNPKRYIHLKVF